ncbi:MAG: DUF2490 domain-containing protein [Bacteroidaceae bacterium]|nr:DUF2490 domain-containing protein [Bacteroidaceae bacterium]
MKRLLLFLALLPALALQAQSDDFGLWTGIGFDKNINKQWTVGAGTDLRFEDNVSKVTRAGFDVGVTYKPFKFLRLGLGYAYMRDRVAGETAVNYSTDDTGASYQNGYNADPSFRRDKNRVYFQATGRYKLGRFTFSLRERLQYTHFQPAQYTRTKYRNCELTEDEALIYELTGEPVYTLTDNGTTRYFSQQPEAFNGGYYASETADRLKHSKHKLYLRSRLQAAYNIKGLPLEPYASFEVSNNLREGFALEKRRWTVGLDYTLQKRHTFGLAYIYSNGADDDNSGNLHAVQVSYTIKL